MFPSIPQGTHPTLNGIDGATAPAPNIEFAFGESDLDFQISYPLIFPQTITLFQTVSISSLVSPAIKTVPFHPKTYRIGNTNSNDTTG